MKKLAPAAAMAVSLLSLASATAGPSVDRLDRFRSGTMAPIETREACDDRSDALAFLSCGVPKRGAAERPAWRGLY